MSIEGDRLTDLILGFFIDAEIVTDSAENILLLPAEAMRRELDVYYVFTMDEESRLTRKKFKPGIQSDMFVEVVSGLTIDDRVVLNPTGLLEDGMLLGHLWKGNPSINAQKGSVPVLTLYLYVVSLSLK